ncbi:alpha/beta fold hydrolase [Saccharothrix coeruleofusca]|uniref:AB hydrolase-1 domain-containing protein n=1 Tax=Saccharothrix coeruleofusca TaxID=33919 RepID=A0A918EH63_9PSEU|nr:alpha/beta hydrolase [Saccharothrix coeruleofusca]MBP2336643.1 pimeloyl-ACP methyl ester carboxylesterase [Saccharothrix coeruleofusca]GGP79007.1 hypothetical protein GCM10010185_61140 [Saccharothrix coeruleofusca]
MLNPQTRQAVTDVVAAVQSVRPLAAVLEHPVRVAMPGPPETRRWFHRVAERLGAPYFAEAGGQPSAALDRVVSGRLGLDRLPPIAEEHWPEADAAVADAEARGFAALCRQAVVTADDGVRVLAHAAGDPTASAVVVASACGMPAALAEPWVRGLARSHHVLTWESRGLFGAPRDLREPRFDAATDVAAQVRDAIAVMDHFGVARAHVVGLCGGAVLAVVAAHEHPERVSSLSLWHGDFELGAAAPKTSHQKDLQALMALAARDRASARAVHATLTASMLTGTPPDLAHLVLYPYATPELLFRYCLLNGAIMGTDVGPLLAEVPHPALVVTSRDDRTAHPDGSRHVAERLPGGRLVVLPHGDHLSLFRGTAVLEIAERFAADPGADPLTAPAHS